jgi:predicted permease
MFSRGRRYRELAESMREHLAERIEDLVGGGMSRRDAEYQARREFGNVTRIEEQSREVWQWPRVESLWADVKFALRQMRRSPGFALTAIGTLALGIAAAAAMFTVVDHVLLRPVPYRDAGRLMDIVEADRYGKGTWPQPWLDIEQWIKQSRSFESLAMSGGMGARNYLERSGTAVAVDGTEVSANLFATLGVEPQLGRGFRAEAPDARSGKNTGTIVLSDALWRAAFGADRGVIGRTVRINDMAYTVVGVMPAGFRYPAGVSTTPQVWVPLELTKADYQRNSDSPSYQAIGRLRRGVKPAEAKAELSLIQKQNGAQYENAEMGKDHSAVTITPCGSRLVDEDTRKALWALLSAAGVLWLIATVNVTNLLLARGMARQREMAMRGALGASRGRVVQQMMVEGLLLSGMAGLAGIGLAMTSVKLLADELVQHLPLPAPSTPDGWILPVLLGMTVVSAMVATAGPALLWMRTPIEQALKQGGQQAGSGRNHNRVRGGLVAVEVALSLTLLVACGLLLRTIYSLRHVPLGFRTDHILVASLSIPSQRFEGRNLTVDLYQPLLERVQHMHGVETAGLMTDMPLSRNFLVSLTLYQGDRNPAYFKAVTPEIGKVLGMQMAAGRYFDASDAPTSQPVVVVNETFARLHSPDQHNPRAILGTKPINMRKGVPAVVVGILKDEHQGVIAGAPAAEVEIAIPQLTPESAFYQMGEGIAMELAVRTEVPTKQMIPEIRDVLRQASPELEDSDITTMDQIVEDSYGSQRLAAHLLEIFGGSALLLCVAGLYGLLAYVVSQRTRELGVRIALGAQRGNLLWLVMRQAAGMLVAGVVVGVGLALVSGRLVRGFLYGVKAHDGWTVGGAAIVLLVSGLLAAYVPARRAAGVDPMGALRSE